MVSPNENKSDNFEARSKRDSETGVGQFYIVGSRASMRVDNHLWVYSP
jgi:hypothetical protein